MVEPKYITSPNTWGLPTYCPTSTTVAVIAAADIVWVISSISDQKLISCPSATFDAVYKDFCL